MARKRRKKSEEPQASGGWLASFADTMTLLMTFFVLLYSMAEVDSEKIKQMSVAFQEVFQGQSADSIHEFDLHDGEVPIVGGETELETPTIPNESEEDYTYEELKRYIEENKLESSITLERTKDGIMLQLGENVLFKSGESKFSNTAILDKISEVILKTTGDVEIEGHTDNIPLNRNGQSNWELSVERSVNVVRYFIEGKKVEASRLSAVGYGEYKPIADNSTPQGRGANRRVSVLFVSSDD
ncbi:flagellar motor protein MotB [uncultured Clostridium sp.]|jgi:chemotaxis protein MotB|uniref:OmpA/MotB family protein n=1 Tax=uncultured Clostridium sp. TaxID=59620 RepID=UPI0026397CC5|nr:flagellar motor protein MotB [uncultured Clostridium sp.]